MMIVPVIVIMVMRMIVTMAMIVVMRMRVTMRVFPGPVVLVVDRLHPGSDGHFGRRLRVEHLAEQQHQGRSAEREEWDQPDEI